MPPRPTILAVESEQREAHSLAAAVKNPEWEVVAATDAPSAIKAAREINPAVMILSSRVLGGGGVVTLKRLRTSAHTATIPVVGVAGSGMRDAMLEAGAQECLAERTSGTELQDAVKRQLAKRPVVLEAPAEVVQDPSRLEALNRTRLLDSGADESYDRLTRIASSLLNVPTMLVSLVDHDRQYFKSQVGLAEPWASKRETPLSHSFCQWVVSSGEDLIVADARKHDTLQANKAVGDLGAVAYAGVVLNAPRGEAIGTLCAIDSSPRQWTETELWTLQDLRDITEALVALDSADQESSRRVDLVSRALSAAVRVLVRPSDRFTERDRSDLVAVIDQMSRNLRS